MTTLAILQGIGIGFAIAAPVGPIGMLCIRRSLHHGAVAGLATGLGAAMADAMYGLVAAGGLGVAGWLVGHATAISLGGAALLAWLGLESLRAFARKARVPAGTRRAASNEGAAGAGQPAGAAEAADDPVPGTSPQAAFLSTFALTASNPMTIVSFVGVIAALGTPGAGGSAWFLVAGVFIGSLLWWMFLVGIVRAVRGAVSPALLRAVDLVTAVILLATAAWVAVRAVG